MPLTSFRILQYGSTSIPVRQKLRSCVYPAKIIAACAIKKILLRFNYILGASMMATCWVRLLGPSDSSVHESFRSRMKTKLACAGLLYAAKMKPTRFSARMAFAYRGKNAIGMSCAVVFLVKDNLFALSSSIQKIIAISVGCGCEAISAFGCRKQVYEKAKPQSRRSNYTICPFWAKRCQPSVIKG